MKTVVLLTVAGSLITFALIFFYFFWFTDEKSKAKVVVSGLMFAAIITFSTMAFKVLLVMLMVYGHVGEEYYKLVLFGDLPALAVLFLMSRNRRNDDAIDESAPIEKKE